LKNLLNVNNLKIKNVLLQLAYFLSPAREKENREIGEEREKGNGGEKKHDTSFVSLGK